MIGIVFQSFNLIPTMTALENVEAPLYIHSKWRQANPLALEMLRQVGLSDRYHHLPHQLSGGEQQRVAIARALVTSPRLLLADEPTGNLDSVTSKQILTLVQQLRIRMGLTVIMVTHDFNRSRSTPTAACISWMGGWPAHLYETPASKNLIWAGDGMSSSSFFFKMAINQLRRGGQRILGSFPLRHIRGYVACRHDHAFEIHPADVEIGAV